jgi:hypothetical protein
MSNQTYFGLKVESSKSKIEKEEPERKTRFCWIELITNLGKFESKVIEVSESGFFKKQDLVEKWAAGFYINNNNFDEKRIEIPTLTIQLEDNSLLTANTALLKNAIIILRHKSNSE